MWVQGKPVLNEAISLRFFIVVSCLLRYVVYKANRPNCPFLQLKSKLYNPTTDFLNFLFLTLKWYETRLSGWGTLSDLALAWRSTYPFWALSASLVDTKGECRIRAPSESRAYRWFPWRQCVQIWLVVMVNFPILGPERRHIYICIHIYIYMYRKRETNIP